MMLRSTSDSANEGFALFAVLGFMMLLALILMPFSASSRLQFLISVYRYDQTRFATMAEAINNYLAWRLAGESSFRQEAEEGNFLAFSCAVSNASIQFRIVPHSRLVNLNAAEPALLEPAFQVAGLGPVESRDAAEDVVRYRTPLDNEADGADKVAGGYKRAPFEDLSELHDFAALRHLPLDQLGLVFSTYSGKSIASAELNGGRTQHVTIETMFNQSGRWGGEIAIFLLGSAQSPARRMASMPAGNKAPKALSAGSCESILPVAVQALVREAL